jgi:monoamine oxidase
MNIYDYIIIGGGISGLYAGYKLVGEKKILILESNSILGGRAQTVQFHGVRIAIGAGIGRVGKDKLLKKLLKDLDIPFEKFTVRINWAFDNLDVKKIFKSLKSSFVKSAHSHLTFKQYALTQLDKKTYSLLVKSIGLTDYENEDVEETLYWYGMEDNMDGLEAFGVNWTELVLTLGQKIRFNGGKIKLNSQVNKINYLDDCVELETNEKKYYCSKLIIGCNIDGIKKLLPGYSRLYSNIKSNSFIRIYGHFVSKHKKQMDMAVNSVIYVSSYLYKIIPIDKSSGVYMIGYSDNKSANKLIELIESVNNIEWLEQMLTKSLGLKEQIQINEIAYFYWKNGTHYFRPLSETVYTSREKYIQAVQNPRTNVYVCGEAVARSHGWVEGALESVELIL